MSIQSIKTTQKNFRPLITSLAFNDQQKYLPMKYNYTVEQIQSIKKYLPKNLFKLYGIDCKEIITKNDEEMLQKAKLKIKAKNGMSIETNKELKFFKKNEVTMLQWPNKCINLKIPYNPKDTNSLIESYLMECVDFYLQNCFYFKNNLNQELLKTEKLQTNELSYNEIANDIDIVFIGYEFECQSNQTMIKQINIKIPLILCLSNNKQKKYSLRKIKDLIKLDISYMINIMIKNNYNTRIIYLGKDQKEFIQLNSYCNEQNKQNQEIKLKKVLNQHFIRQQQNIIINQSQIKKQKIFLIGFLIILILIYLILKLFPIHQPDPYKYIQQNKNYQDLNQNTTIKQHNQDIF